MAKKRDLKKEYQQSKNWNIKLTIVAAGIPKTLAEDFTAKVELENTTKSAKIKEFITNYTYSGKD